MKKILIVTLLSLFGFSWGIAQEYEYIPFVREGVKWVCSDYFTPQCCFTLELKGDAVFGGKSYKSMHKYSGKSIDEENDTILVYLREENKVVYAIVPDGKNDAECPVGIIQDADMQEKISSGMEFVLYDFNDAEAFIGKWTALPLPVRTVIPDMTTVGGRLAKRYISKLDNEFCAIEGVGYDGLYSSWYPLGNGGSCVLNWIIEDGDTIYSSERYKGVNPGRLSSDLLPMAREGVKWVNERVIIDHGVETSEYYTYEFCGTDFHGYPICYSYKGENLDISQAQKAAIFQASYGNARFTNYIFNDVPFSDVIEQGRDMIIYSTGWPIYQFACTGSDIEMTNPVNYYILTQKEDFLNRENFVEVEPLMIEDFVCRRFAYLGEDGQPLAYVIEGIGFDSRDMGDLLTPFTRKPDPDADYQEWCGLSHVIKDGKIIYKGMRYKEQTLIGDVNGDGEVNISDVTALIDYLLTYDLSLDFNLSFDVNSDRRLNISDVTSLINILLTM